jgi:bla regulator protein blaR1
MMFMIADVIAPLERLFQVLITASIAGAVVIAAVAAVSRFTSITPSLRCTLWWLATLKLLVALVWIEPVVLRILPPSDRLAPVSSKAAAYESSKARLGSSQSTIAIGVPNNVRRDISWRAVASTVWIAGAIAGVGVMLFRIRRTVRIVADARAADVSIRLVVRDLCARTGVRRRVDVRWSDDIDAPMVAGLVRPVILLPAGRFDALSRVEQQMAICHEIVHLRRGDLWLGCVPALSERLFFFHPLAMLAAREYLLAREAACDRAVLKLLGAAPHEYGRLLLSLGVSPMRAGLAAAGSSRSFANLKRRIAMLGHRSPSSLARLAGWLIAGAAVCALMPIQLGARASLSSPKVLPKQLKALPWAAAPEKTASPTTLPPAAAAQEKAASKKVGSDRVEFVLVNRDRRGVTMSGSWQDAERVKRKHGVDRFLWFRHDGKEYVVTDATALDEAEQVYRPVAVIGAKQGEVGAKQGAVGAKQGAVGARQGEIGAKQGAIGAKQGHIGAQQGALAAREMVHLSETEQRELEAEHERLEKEMASLNEEMAKLSEEMQRASEPMSEYDDEMRQLSKEMEGLNSEMATATEKANREMAALFERLINQGLAQVEP